MWSSYDSVGVKQQTRERVIFAEWNALLSNFCTDVALFALMLHCLGPTFYFSHSFSRIFICFLSKPSLPFSVDYHVNSQMCAYLSISEENELVRILNFLRARTECSGGETYQWLLKIYGHCGKRIHTWNWIWSQWGSFLYYLTHSYIFRVSNWNCRRKQLWT